MLVRQKAVRPPLWTAMSRYGQELADRRDVFKVFMRVTTELPLDIQRSIWSLVPLPEPPRID